MKGVCFSAKKSKEEKRQASALYFLFVFLFSLASRERCMISHKVTEFVVWDLKYQICCNNNEIHQTTYFLLLCKHDDNEYWEKLRNLLLNEINLRREFDGNAYQYLFIKINSCLWPITICAHGIIVSRCSIKRKSTTSSAMNVISLDFKITWRAQLEHEMYLFFCFKEGY